MAASMNCRSVFSSIDSAVLAHGSAAVDCFLEVHLLSPFDVGGHLVKRPIVNRSLRHLTTIKWEGKRIILRIVNRVVDFDQRGTPVLPL